MKRFALALFLLTISSSAFAYCPEVLPAGYAGKPLKNYDGTCTVLSPTLSDRGIQKWIVGDVDLACAAFGFGAKSGVDAVTIMTPTLETEVFVFGSGPSRGFMFDRLTCRQSAKK